MLLPSKEAQIASLSTLILPRIKVYRFSIVTRYHLKFGFSVLVWTRVLARLFTFNNVILSGDESCVCFYTHSQNWFQILFFDESVFLLAFISAIDVFHHLITGALSHNDMFSFELVISFTEHSRRKQHQEQTGTLKPHDPLIKKTEHLH